MKAAREGQKLPRKRQSERYESVERRLPRLEAPGHETLGEIAAMAPLFLESLKTGFVLMRSRPHTGAICGGLDQAIIASPMVRAGDQRDDSALPRTLAAPSGIRRPNSTCRRCGPVSGRHVQAVGLKDFVYLITAAQWISHCNDQELLRRLTAKCTHMLRVMLDDADPKTGLIPCRDIFPDFPPLNAVVPVSRIPRWRTGSGTKRCDGGRV